MCAREIALAAAVVRNGGVIAYATESCFGLGCDPSDRAAVVRLLRVKRRPAHKGLILMAADIEQLRHYVTRIPRKALLSWPGPYTWLLDATAGTPAWIRGAHACVAVRVTRHAQAAALCRAARMAIVSTSANRSGETPARSYYEALRRLGDELDYVLPGQIGGLRSPTPILHGVTGNVIRSA